MINAVRYILISGRKKYSTPFSQHKTVLLRDMIPPKWITFREGLTDHRGPVRKQSPIPASSYARPYSRVPPLLRALMPPPPQSCAPAASIRSCFGKGLNRGRVLHSLQMLFSRSQDVFYVVMAVDADLFYRSRNPLKREVYFEEVFQRKTYVLVKPEPTTTTTKRGKEAAV